MKVQVVLKELKGLFSSRRHGNWWSWEHEGFSKLFEEADISKALEIAAEAVRDMQNKQSLDDGSYFALQNELNEKLLVYNLLLQAKEKGNGTVGISRKDLDWLKERTSNCVLMDYGGYLGEFMSKLLKGQKTCLPEGVHGFHF